MKSKMCVDDSFMGGITLAGYVRDDGSIESISGHVIEQWPAELTIDGTTFTFEYARFVGDPRDPRGKFYNAEYV